MPGIMTGQAGPVAVPLRGRFLLVDQLVAHFNLAGNLGGLPLRHSAATRPRRVAALRFHRGSLTGIPPPTERVRRPKE